MPRRPRAPRPATPATPATRGESGFTLVELLVATTLSLCLVLPAYALLDGTFRNAALVNSRFARDAQARQVMTLLGDGTASYGTLKNARGFAMVEGIRSRATVPSNMAQSASGQFTMSDTAPGGLLGGLVNSAPTIAGDSVPPVTVQCTAAGVPLPSCNAPGSGLLGLGSGPVTTQGWMGAAPVLTTQGCTVAVDITVSDPFQAARPRQTAAGVTDTYRGLFGLDVETNPTGPGPSQPPPC